MSDFSASDRKDLGGQPTATPTVLRIARLYGLPIAEVERLTRHSSNSGEVLRELQRCWNVFAKGLEGQDSTSSWLRWLSRKSGDRTPREVLLREGVDSFANYVRAAAASHKGAFYIERRPQGDYAVRRLGAQRASAVESTQSQAIERARSLDSDAVIHVERMRGMGGPDKWRGRDH